MRDLALPLAVTFAAIFPACRSAAAREEPRTLRVAVCQILVDGDPVAARERVAEAVRVAAAQGAQLACFPEACLFGWVNPEAHAGADPVPGATTEWLGELARRHGVMLSIGLAERDGDRTYNCAVLVDLDGALLLHHRKVNVLPELMTPPYAAGVGATACAETRFGRIGLLICADTFVDDLVSELAAASPDLVLVPYGWAAPADAWPGHASSLHGWIAHTARRTGAVVVGVDSVGALVSGPWAGHVLGGQSAVADAAGNLLEPLADRAPEVRTFELEW